MEEGFRDVAKELKGLKKVFSKHRSSEPDIDGTIQDLRTDSIDSLVSIEKSPTRQSTRSISQDGSSKSGSSGVRKLLPGHSKRQRRKQREQELKAAVEDLGRGRTGREQRHLLADHPTLVVRLNAVVY